MTGPRELLTVGQVAAELGVHERTVREYIYRGDLGCYRLGRSLRVTRAQVDDLLKRSRVRRQKVG